MEHLPHQPPSRPPIRPTGPPGPPAPPGPTSPPSANAVGSGLGRPPSHPGDPGTATAAPAWSDPRRAWTGAAGPGGAYPYGSPYAYPYPPQPPYRAVPTPVGPAGPSAPARPAPPPRRPRPAAPVAIGAIVVALALVAAAGGSAFLRAARTVPGLGTLVGARTTPVPAGWEGVTTAVEPGVVNIETRLVDGRGAGTGMVVAASGVVLTNAHVVSGAQGITVTVATTGESFRATVVGTDETDDVALLHLQGASGLPTVPVGDPGEVGIGDPVAAIGNAGGAGGDPAVAPGYVVALGRTITATDSDGRDAEVLRGMIQVAADVQPGDSGGPLADANGKVVGMTTAASAGDGRYRMRTASSQGFAIPIDRALAIARQLGGLGG